MNKKVFYNPNLKDKVTVLATAEDTNNEYLLVEVELAVGGGTPKHYHTSFTEEFIAVEGTLGISLNKKQLLLHPGESAAAKKMEVHRFFNPVEPPIRFHVKITPAQNRFLESLCIGYGLAEDGKTTKKGVPKRMDHLAVMLQHSDTRLTGLIAVAEPFFLRRAAKAKRKGVLDELIQTYCY